MPMLEGVKSAADTMKQLITMATALLGFTVTFAGEFKTKDAALTVPPTLWWSWVFFVISIALAFWALMAVTGSINTAEQSNTAAADAMGPNIVLPAGLSILTFLAAVVLMVWAGGSIARLSVAAATGT